jgi:hypothetical protein
MQQNDDFVIQFKFTGIMRNREDCVLKVGIIGNNQRGRAIQQLQCSSIDIYLYDNDPELCFPVGTVIADLEQCDLIFNCISTSIDYHSYFHMDNLLHATTLLHHPYQIIYASTPIGFADSNGCGFMPECIMNSDGEYNVKNVNYWVFGLPASNTEECKQRLQTLITICHVEGATQSSVVYWLTATEAELLNVSRQAVRMSYIEMYQSLSDLAMVKGIAFNNVKLLLDMDPTAYPTSVPTNDMHLLYGQFQKAGIESHYIESIVEREKKPIHVAMPTTKKISLVIPSTNDKLTEDVCRNLVKKDNLVILFAPTTTLLLDDDGNILQNVISKTGTFLTKQFFPRLDYIWDFSKMDTCKTCNTSLYSVRSAAMIETMNKLELVKQHNCSLTFISDHDENDVLIQSFVAEYPQYKNTVEIIHILFDKSERSEYVLRTQ